MSQIKCWFCEEAIEDTLKDCPHCNMPVITFPTVKYEPKETHPEPDGCKKCGRQLPPNAAFCPSCGAQVTEEDAENAEESTPQKEEIVEKAIESPAKSTTKITDNGAGKNIHAYAKKQNDERKKKKNGKAFSIIVASLSLVIVVGFLKVSYGQPKYNISTSQPDGASYSVKSGTEFKQGNSGSVGSGMNRASLSEAYQEGKKIREQEPKNAIVENSDQPESSLTLGQENALRSAKQYIAVMDFSYTGLVEQLEYEGYSHDDAVYGADNCGADWMAEAAGNAKSYMDVMSFSRQGLLDQLLYEGYTQEQAEHGVASVGY